ncbi:hypothetical protein F4678DRAFT_363679 [Xylaria arbuscula]|nr:hypothetical protein F4678DRAFT_363679 [Xylaria arbuscula]
MTILFDKRLRLRCQVQLRHYLGSAVLLCSVLSKTSGETANKTIGWLSFFLFSGVCHVTCRPPPLLPFYCTFYVQE